MFAMAFNIVAGCYCILAKRAILRVGADPPSGEGISTQWRDDLQHRGPTTAVAEATVVADTAPVLNVVVPAGVAAGQQFAIMTPSGAQLTIVCPAGVGPGQTISVMA